MDKTLWFNLTRSVTITLLVAIIFSYFLTYMGLPFLPTCLALIILQFIVFYFIGEYVNNRKIKLLISADTEITKERLKQFTSVVCPCDRKIETDIPIKISEPNSYRCPGCDKQISVFVETKTALSTEPLFVNPLDTPLITEEVEKMIKNNADK